MPSDHRLTRKQFDKVIRRAAELATEDTDSSEFSEAELFRIARDVGLADEHVRRALGELRGRGGEGRAGGLIDRLFGPSKITAARVVPGELEALAATIDEFLVAGRLLQPVRSTERALQYRPAVDWASQIARAASSTSRRYYMASARAVDVRIDPLDEEGRVRVEFTVDPGTRGDSMAGAALGGLLGGGGAGFGVGFLVAAAGPPELAAMVGLAVAATMAGVLAWAMGRSHQRKLGEVRLEAEDVLDRLAEGRGLEPPPPAWRRWVERQFHGARRLIDDRDQ